MLPRGRGISSTRDVLNRESKDPTRIFVFFSLLWSETICAQTVEKFVIAHVNRVDGVVILGPVFPQQIYLPLI